MVNRGSRVGCAGQGKVLGALWPQKRLHHNVLAIALANTLARIAWAVLNKGRAFECLKTEETASRPA
jgi:hypothetical protein